MRQTSDRNEMPFEKRLDEQYRNMRIFAAMKNELLVEYYSKTIGNMFRSAKPVIGDAQRDRLLKDAQLRYENSLPNGYGRETPYYPVTSRIDRKFSKLELKVVK